MCCQGNCECVHPKEKRDPKTCTPEQIQECHGDVTEHPCEVKAEEGQEA